MKYRSMVIIGLTMLSWGTRDAHAACVDLGSTGQCNGPVRTVIRKETGVLFGFLSDDLLNLGCGLQPHSDGLSYVFIPAGAINANEYAGLLTISAVSGATATVEVSSNAPSVPCTVLSVGLKR